jgi:hypothetical protein
MSRRDEHEAPVVVNGKVKAATAKAVLIEVADPDEPEGSGKTIEAWFPRSQTEGLDEVIRGEQVEFNCAAWLARDKGLA